MEESSKVEPCGVAYYPDEGGSTDCTPLPRSVRCSDARRRSHTSSRHPSLYSFRSFEWHCPYKKTELCITVNDAMSSCQLLNKVHEGHRWGISSVPRPALVGHRLRL